MNVRLLLILNIKYFTLHMACCRRVIKYTVQNISSTLHMACCRRVIKYTVQNVSSTLHMACCRRVIKYNLASSFNFS